MALCLRFNDLESDSLLRRAARRRLASCVLPGHAPREGFVKTPGLVLGLDQGGHCNGVALRILQDVVESDMKARDARDSLRAAVARVLITLANVSPTDASAKANWARKRLSSSLTARPCCCAPPSNEARQTAAWIQGGAHQAGRPYRRRQHPGRAAPSPVPGAGGFSLRLEDRAGLNKEALAKATNALVTAATPRPGTRMPR